MSFSIVSCIYSTHIIESLCKTNILSVSCWCVNIDLLHDQQIFVRVDFLSRVIMKSLNTKERLIIIETYNKTVYLCWYPEERVLRIQALSQDEWQDGRSCAPTYPVAPAPAFWLRIAPEPSRAPWLQPPPPGSGQLRSRHVPRGSSSRLLIKGSFRAARCPITLAPDTWLRVALKPPCALWPAPVSYLRVAPEPPHVPWGPLRAMGY
jgi:hypothetical protein